MQKLSLCVLFVLALVQDSAPADLLTLCSPDEPDERLGNNTGEDVAQFDLCRLCDHLSAAFLERRGEGREPHPYVS